MKILFILEYFYPHIGGLETAFMNLAKALISQRNEVTIVTTRLPKTKQNEIINGIRITRVNTPPVARRYWFTFAAIPALIRVVNQFDVIHTTTYNAAFPAWVVAKLFRKKVILTVHEVFGKDWFSLEEKNKLLLLLFYLYERFIFLLPFDEYRAVSKFTKRNLISRFNIPKNKVSVVYNIIDKKFWDPKKYDKNKIRKKFKLEDSFIYLFFGRPGISKGLEYLIQAVPIIKEKIPNSKLILILSRDPFNRYQMIKSMVGRLKVSNDVIFIDPVDKPELPEYILSANCVVVPSLSEGFGYSSLEASTLGVPLIATKVGAIPEVLSKSIAIFIKPKSSIGIANAVTSIFNP